MEDVDEFVRLEVETDSSDLMRPHEAETLALNLLGAASMARAHEIAQGGGVPSE